MATEQIKVILGSSPGEESKNRDLIIKKIRKSIKMPCQKILLIHPQHIPEDHFLIKQALSSRYWSYQPYGCGVLCRDLEARGYTTDILDLNFDMLNQAHELRDNFRYSMWTDWLIDKLDIFKPDVVGISCMFTMSHEIIKNIARTVKEYSHELSVIGGGVHLSNASKNVLKDCENIDFIGTYEGDRSFPDLIDFVNKKKPADCLAQIATQIDGKYIVIESRATPETSEIDAKPIYHSLPIERYSSLGQIGTYGFIWKREGRKGASTLIKRGCRARCSFCSVRTFNGPGVRERSTQSVLDEIKELYEKGINHITLLDDDPLHDKTLTLEFFNGLTALNLDLTWDASNGLIAAAITEENMKAMAESGCIGFNLGIESGNPEILRHVHKPGTVETFLKSKKIFDKYPHVFVKGFLIIGFPNETMSQLMDTVNLSIELNLDWYAIQVLNPLPSTEIYDEMIALGLAQDKLETSDIAYVFGPHGKQHLREQQEKIRSEDFLNLLETSDPEMIPNKQQLKDLWFLIDYKLNYEKILKIDDPIKLRKLELQLEDICNRIAPDSAIAHLFSGIIAKKLGNIGFARLRADQTSLIINGDGTDNNKGSAYWKNRFNVLDLYYLLDDLRK
ncbi:hypothetical protein A3J19_05015 [Candidatus Daviesbacteria bacterium RIFCSPLOWO2_02_FULL_41_8]|uniref:Uncharacterized protein n=1 Tax=Candidatus Daviesbacteria bacterium RIFCSPLOWO2_02_FULL_41_8 TaxID=1797798 RepID=A0A1F5NM35_9BACT|nr:MAG: hypothetical protein A3J19_05015 [Candidatus Daviesbacteria bacterium RIFCSPLOWO2_02_FULL_41_8]